VKAQSAVGSELKVRNCRHWSETWSAHSLRSGKSISVGLRRGPRPTRHAADALRFAPRAAEARAVRRFLLNRSKGVGLRREAMKVEQQVSFLQVEFRVGQVASVGGGGFGYVVLRQVRV